MSSERKQDAEQRDAALMVLWEELQSTEAQVKELSREAERLQERLHRALRDRADLVSAIKVLQGSSAQCRKERLQVLAEWRGGLKKIRRWLR